MVVGSLAFTFAPARNKRDNISKLLDVTVLPRNFMQCCDPAWKPESSWSREDLHQQ